MVAGVLIAGCASHRKVRDCVGHPGRPFLFNLKEAFYPDYVPVPVRVTTCGLPGGTDPSSLMTIFAFRAPVPVGLNITVKVQLAPTAMLGSQVLVWEKSWRFSPTIVVGKKLMGLVPTFVNVTFCGVLVVPTA